MTALIRRTLLLLLPLLAFMVPVERAAAQDIDKPEITVGYRVNPPFVTRAEDGTYSGMAADLWREIANGLDFTPQYVEYESVSDLLAATEKGEIDVAVGAISITEERAERVDFTQPWFDSGLRVMIDNRASSSLANIWDGLAEAGFLRYYAWLIFFIIAGTVGLTIFDRRFDKSFTTSWREGVAESFYSVMLVVTKGSLPSRSKLFGWYGRIFSAIWLVLGIAVVAYVTSSVTSVMTSIAVTGDITGPDDLPGRTIGVFSGSTAETMARREGIDFVRYTNIDAAVEGLRGDDVDALVTDAPVLEYYKFTHPDLGLDVVGRLFSPEKYGFAMPYGESALTDRITVQLLGLHEDGTVERLAENYFGDER